MSRMLKFSSINRNTGHLTPDTPAAWISVIAAFSIVVIYDGIAMNIGLFVDPLIHEYNATVTEVAIIGSLMGGMPMIASPLVAVLLSKYNYKFVAYLGALLASGGFFIAYFSRSVFILMFTIGGLTGIGLSMLDLPVTVMIATLFVKKRVIASGVVESATGIGMMAFAPLISFLFTKFSVSSVFLLLSGFHAQTFIFISFFSVLESQTVSRMRKMKIHLSELCREMKLLNQKQKEFSQEIYRICEQEHLIELGKEFEFTTKMFHQFYITKCNIDINFNEKEFIATSNSHHHHQHHHHHSESIVGVPPMLVQNPYKYPLRNKNSCNLALNSFDEMSPVASSTEGCLSSFYEFSLPGLSLIPLNVLQEPHSGFRTCNGVGITQNTNLLPSFVAEMDNNLNSPKNKKWFCNFCFLNFLFEEYQFLSSRTFQIYVLSNLLLSLGSDVTNIFLIDYKLHDQPESIKSLINCLLGGSYCIGQLLTGILVDKCNFNCFLLHFTSTSLAGLSASCLPLLNSLPLLCAFAICYGFMISANITLNACLTIEFVGLRNLASAMSFVLFAQGIGTIVGPPIAGILHEKTNSYIWSFVFSGVSIIVSSLTFLSIGIKKICYKPVENDKQQQTLHHFV